jgi:L-glyceraldehyde 3-phosphate reductase
LIHQPKYSMFVRWIEEGLLDVLEEEGIGCIPFSPLAQGLLTGRYLKGIPEGSRATREVFLKKEHVDTAHDKIVKLNEIALQRGQSLAQMALAWVLRDKRITSVLIGASSVKQIDDNVETLRNLSFSDEELQAVEKILK